jgi:UDP:flavonoid glycosyltransferase YjiC (YdhE family)
VHDWREEVKLLKDLRHNNRPILAGIYHSDLAPTDSDSQWTMKFKRQIRDISQKTTDIFFHINLSQPDVIPELSTLYVPIPLIGRDITMHPALVKQMLGLHKDEPFILVQMGGGIGKYRYKYMQEWYTKLNRIRLPFKIVVASQLTDSDFSFGSHVIRAPLFENGINLVNAADMVISKPGMGILTDCICTGTPLLALPADTKERQVKNMMLKDLIGSEIAIASNESSELDLINQICKVLDIKDYMQEQFRQVPTNGANVIAEALKLLNGQSLKEMPKIHQQILKLTPFKVK